MATVLLVRHGRSTANSAGVLAGRAPGVVLDDTGRVQAEKAAQRLVGVPLTAVVSSPLERCLLTAHALLAPRDGSLTIEHDEGLVEADYGTWQGGRLSDLVKEPLWSSVQRAPSSVTFPGGESMTAMQDRAVAAVRHHDAVMTSAHGAQTIWVAVSHADVIKSIVADALGTPLDQFQRISIDPASITIITYGSEQPQVVAVNTTDGDLSWLAEQAKVATTSAGVVGGGAGHP